VCLASNTKGVEEEGGRRERYCTRHGAFTLLSLETYNLYSIASQLKRLCDPVTSAISGPGRVGL